MTSASPALERKAPPNNPEAEMAVLGGILLRNDAFDLVRDLLDPQDFYQAAHQHIFHAITNLRDRSEAVDPLTLKAELKKLDRFTQVGGSAYVNRLLDEVHTTANIEAYARMVSEAATLRSLSEAAVEIQQAAYEQRDKDGQLIDAEQIVSQAQERMAAVAQRQRGIELVNCEAAMQSALDLYDRASSGETGQRTGFRDIDDIFNGGIRNHELIILAARPAMGKSALAAQIAESISRTRPVYFASLEMDAASISQRLISSLSGIPLSNILRGTLNAEAEKRLADAAQHLSTRQLIFDDSSAPTVQQIHARVRRIMAERGDLALVVIDYLQLMSATGRHDNREREISTISRNLKLITKDLGVPVLALSQLNRRLEGQTNKRPKLSDLRESGSLEQDADKVLGIYRDEVYDTDTIDRGIAEVIVLKQRNGRTGTVKLAFTGECVRFADLSRREEWNES